MLGKFAQEIAGSTARIIDHSIIITDTKGIVIGASVKDRIGSFHEASISVIEKRQGEIVSEEEASQLVGTMQGITYPIQNMGQEIVGTVAIIGIPKEVTPFALIVKKQIEMLIREKQLSDSATNKENALQNVIQDIAHFVSGVSDREILLLRAREMGFDPKLLYVPIAIDLYQFGRYVHDRWRKLKKKGESPEFAIETLKREILLKIRNIFNYDRDISAIAGNNKYIIFCVINPQTRNYREKVYERVNINCQKILDALKEKGLKAAIGIGFFAEGIEQLSSSYREAWQALLLGKKFNQGPGVYDIQDFRLEELLASLKPELKVRYIKDYLEKLKNRPDWTEMRNTLMAWSINRFNYVRTANDLHIHRNTLEYRLNKIHRLTGRNPKKFKENQELYIAFRLDSFTEPAIQEK